MKTFLRFILPLPATALGALTACGPAEPEDPLGLHEDALRILVSTPPHASVVEKLIMGTEGEELTTPTERSKMLHVELLIEPGQDPHSFQPTPSQIERIMKCQLWFRAGLPFEEGLIERIQQNAPEMEIVDLREGVDLLHMNTHCEEHGHDHDHSHAHEYPDPHIWLSAVWGRHQQETIVKKLRDHLPAQYLEDLESAYARSNMAWERVKKTMTTELAPHRGRAFYVFHPAYGYLARDYGLEQIAIESGGKDPSPQRLKELTERAREDGAKVIFAQNQFDKSSANAIAREIGAEVIELNPLDPNYPACLGAMAKKIALAFEETEPAAEADDES